jgi:hypothetical protein
LLCGLPGFTRSSILSSIRKLKDDGMGTTLADVASGTILSQPAFRPPARAKKSKIRLPEDLVEGYCTASAAAEVVSLLQGRPLTEQDLLRKAVGLGLLRLPTPGVPVALASTTANRVLLGGYRLPAHLERGKLVNLQPHLEAGRLVIVLLAGTLPPDGSEDGGDIPPDPAGDPVSPPPMRAARVVAAAADSNQVSLLPGGPGGPPVTLALHRFISAWAAAGCLMVVALRNWADLRNEGATFFGGFRGSDRAYFWTTAGYDTDENGNLLRVG